jgi:hypothetical protein
MQPRHTHKRRRVHSAIESGPVALGRVDGRLVYRHVGLRTDPAVRILHLHFHELVGAVVARLRARARAQVPSGMGGCSRVVSAVPTALSGPDHPCRRTHKPRLARGPGAAQQPLRESQSHSRFARCWTLSPQEFAGVTPSECPGIVPCRVAGAAIPQEPVRGAGIRYFTRMSRNSTSDLWRSCDMIVNPTASSGGWCCGGTSATAAWGSLGGSMASGSATTLSLASRGR